MKYFIMLVIGLSASFSMADVRPAQEGHCGSSLAIANLLYNNFVNPPAPMIPASPSEAVLLFNGTYVLLKSEASQGGTMETYGVVYTEQEKSKYMEFALLTTSEVLCQLVSVSGDAPGQP